MESKSLNAATPATPGIELSIESFPLTYELAGGYHVELTTDEINEWVIFRRLKIEYREWLEADARLRNGASTDSAYMLQCEERMYDVAKDWADGVVSRRRSADLFQRAGKINRGRAVAVENKGPLSSRGKVRDHMNGYWDVFGLRPDGARQDISIATFDNSGDHDDDTRARAEFHAKLFVDALNCVSAGGDLDAVVNFGPEIGAMVASLRKERDQARAEVEIARKSSKDAVAEAEWLRGRFEDELDRKEITGGALEYWTCKIGPTTRLIIGSGPDGPMRSAIKSAFKDLTGHDAEICFSGWGKKLSNAEREALDDAGAMEARASSAIYGALEIARQSTQPGPSQAPRRSSPEIDHDTPF